MHYFLIAHIVKVEKLAIILFKLGFSALENEIYNIYIYIYIYFLCKNK